MIRALETESPFLRNYGDIRYGRRECDVLLRALVLWLWNPTDYPRPEALQLLATPGCAEVAQQLQEYHAAHGSKDRSFAALAEQLALELWQEAQRN